MGKVQGSCAAIHRDDRVSGRNLFTTPSVGSRICARTDLVFQRFHVFQPPTDKRRNIIGVPNTLRLPDFLIGGAADGSHG